MKEKSLISLNCLHEHNAHNTCVGCVNYQIKSLLRVQAEETIHLLASLDYSKEARDIRLQINDIIIKLRVEK